MNLSKNAWFVCWFNFVQSVIGSEYTYRNGTNLCHFVRVCFFWGGLLVSAIAAVGSAVIFILFVGPFYGLWVGPIAVGIAATIFAVGYGVFRFIGRYGNAIGSGLAQAGSAVRCAIEYGSAVKGKFCPIINFNGGQ